MTFMLFATLDAVNRSVKEPFDLTHWHSHLKACNNKPRKKGAATQSLFAMGFTKAALKSNTVTAASRIEIERSSEGSSTKPCPGVSELDDAESTPTSTERRYLGGGRKIDVIVKELFKKTSSKLLKVRKEEVMVTQTTGHRWKNDHQKLRVFSTSCQKNTPDCTPNCLLPCASC